MGNLTRKKRKKDERSFVVSDSVIVGDRARTEYETSLDSHQQSVRLTPITNLHIHRPVVCSDRWFRDACG